MTTQPPDGCQEAIDPLAKKILPLGAQIWATMSEFMDQEPSGGFLLRNKHCTIIISGPDSDLPGTLDMAWGMPKDT